MQLELQICESEGLSDAKTLYRGFYEEASHIMFFYTQSSCWSERDLTYKHYFASICYCSIELFGSGEFFFFFFLFHVYISCQLLFQCCLTFDTCRWFSSLKREPQQKNELCKNVFLTHTRYWSYNTTRYFKS